METSYVGKEAEKLPSLEVRGGQLTSTKKTAIFASMLCCVINFSGPSEKASGERMGFGVR